MLSFLKYLVYLFQAKESRECILCLSEYRKFLSIKNNNKIREGDKVKIAWLPSARNVPSGTPNAYIGMEGVVEGLRETGEFFLSLSNGGTLVVGKHYEVKKLV